MPITRRRSSRDEETTPVKDEASEETSERPVRRRQRSDSSGEDKPARRQRSEGRASRGWGSFEQKRAKTSTNHDFKPGADNKVLIKFLDDEPFDTYNQHWVDDVPQGAKKSYMCHDDEYFEDQMCPLCGIGEPARTFSLFNILDLTNPRKPEVKVWTAPPTVAGKLKRAGEEKKTSPINREDLYWEVELVKTAKKSEWTLVPVKARDLQDDYEMEPLDAEELASFDDEGFSDRKDVVKVDSLEDLDKLAESLV